ncbi:MAG: DnaJ domain-containing protein [Polyangiaceae bacterium]|nr:DnaJ domain-containing protein [Polyangiaceae bacterium]
MEDLYRTLGVSRTATADQIGKAYRRLARKYHPDLNPGNPSAEEKFKQASAAYEVLSNPDKRKAYDEFGEDSLRSGFDPEQARAYQQWKGRRAAGGRPFGEDTVDFDLGSLFGEIFGQAEARPTGREGDLRAVVELDLAQAVHGAEVSLEVPRSEPCPQCSGTGRAPHTAVRTCPECGGSGKRQIVQGPMRMVATCSACAGTGQTGQACPACGGRGVRQTTRQVTVRIPRGADDGSILRVPADGADGSGNIVIETRVRPHPWLRRDGLDLHLTLPVSLEEAYNGAQIEIPTFGGPVKLRVPPGTQPGTRLRLRGKGVHRAAERGDLYVELDVRLPPGHDQELADAVRSTGSDYARSMRREVRL